MNRVLVVVASLLVAAVASRPASSQEDLLPFPSWPSQILELPSFASAPQLRHSDRNERLSGGPLAYHLVALHGYRVQAYSETSVLAISTAMGNVGGIDCGLREVWSLSVVGDGVLPDGPARDIGLIVVGPDSSGRSRARYAPWSADTSPSDLVFRDLLVPEKAGEHYVLAEVVWGTTFVVEITTGEIRKLIDTDGDGLPDAASSEPPIVLAHSPDLNGVRGFVPAPDGSVILKCSGTCWDEGEFVVIQTPSGAFGYSGTPLKLSRSVKPSIAGHQLVEGACMIRARYTCGASIEVKDVHTGNVIGTGVVHDGHSFCNIPLDPPLELGQSIRLVADDVETEDFVVRVPRSMHVYPGCPHEVVESTSVLLRGFNFPTSSKKLRVEAQWEASGALAILSHEIIGRSTVMVTLPALPKGRLSSTLVLKLSTTDGAPPVYKRMVVTKPYG